MLNQKSINGKGLCKLQKNVRLNLKFKPKCFIKNKLKQKFNEVN
jgi:hypothetical protein